MQELTMQLLPSQKKSIVPSWLNTPDVHTLSTTTHLVIKPSAKSVPLKR
jgi:hypothetical protein